eukprot:1137672-Pelagomonas_calceolata.AAC.3
MKVAHQGKQALWTSLMNKPYEVWRKLHKLRKNAHFQVTQCTVLGNIWSCGNLVVDKRQCKRLDVQVALAGCPPAQCPANQMQNQQVRCKISCKQDVAAGAEDGAGEVVYLGAEQVKGAHPEWQRPP